MHKCDAVLSFLQSCCVNSLLTGVYSENLIPIVLSCNLKVSDDVFHIHSKSDHVLLFQVTPGGKADISQSIAVGDEVIAINGIDCISRSEAIELVRCSRQKLKIKLRR